MVASFFGIRKVLDLVPLQFSGLFQLFQANITSIRNAKKSIFHQKPRYWGKKKTNVKVEFILSIAEAKFSFLIGMPCYEISPIFQLLP